MVIGRFQAQAPAVAPVGSRVGPAEPRATANRDQSLVSATPAGLDAAGLAAFGRLNRADQLALSAVWGPANATDRGRLTQLLTQGQLAKPDARGQTLAADLAALRALTVPAQAPYSADAVFSQVLRDLTDAENLHQSNRNTCAATTIQYMLATSEPAEYVRLATGLMGTGKVSLQGGGVLARAAGSLAPDDSDRPDVSRVMQSALMDQGFHWRGKYDNRTDRYRWSNAAPGPFKTLFRPLGALMDFAVAKLGADFGIGEQSVSELVTRVLGKKAHTAGDVPWTDFLRPGEQSPAVFAQVARAVAKGERVPVDILTDGLADAPGRQAEHLQASGLTYAARMRSHQVLVTQIAGDRVTYRNPWGYETHMSLSEFKSRLTDAVIPG